MTTIAVIKDDTYIDDLLENPEISTGLGLRFAKRLTDRKELFFNLLQRQWLPDIFSAS